MNSLEFSGTIPSDRLKLFSAGDGMLAKANNAPWTDDLQEVALIVMDRGDGVINGSDYLTSTVSATLLSNTQKVYLTAFKQEGNLAGGRYPQVVEPIITFQWDACLELQGTWWSQPVS
ncbi:MAG: hypothetical protein M3342_12550 [Bacteroidota bacterium]|nr:hypothetical protein [Bacteroidota bacterium]